MRAHHCGIPWKHSVDIIKHVIISENLSRMENIIHHTTGCYVSASTPCIRNTFSSSISSSAILVCSIFNGRGYTYSRSKQIMVSSRKEHKPPHPMVQSLLLPCGSAKHDVNPMSNATAFGETILRQSIIVLTAICYNDCKQISLAYHGKFLAILCAY